MATYNLRPGLGPSNVGVIFIDSVRTLDLQRQFTEDATMYAPDADFMAVRVLDSIQGTVLTKIADNPTANEARYLTPILGLVPYTGVAGDAVTRRADGSFDLQSISGGSTDPEVVRDTMASALTAGANVTVTPDDGANTITIAASTDAEVVRDTMAAALTAGANITITPDDGGNIITIAGEGGAAATVPSLRTVGRTGRALRYTNSIANQDWTGISYSTYDLIILHYTSDTSRLGLIKAASPSTLVLAYVDLIYAGTPGTDATLLNVTTARSNGWLATTNGTTEIENPYYGPGVSDQRLLDMGAPGVKEALAVAMAAQLDTDPLWDGLFLDDVNPAYAEGWTVVPTIAGYTTTTMWGSAIKYALQYCKQEITDKLLVGNIGQWVDVPTIGDEIAMALDGAELELFAQDFNRGVQTQTKINNQAASAAALTAAKKIFMGVAQNTNATTDTQTVRYGLAFMHCIAEPGYWVMASHTQGDYGDPEPSITELGRDNGQPLGDGATASGLWTRTYRDYTIQANTTGGTLSSVASLTGVFTAR